MDERPASRSFVEEFNIDIDPTTKEWNNTGNQIKLPDLHNNNRPFKNTNHEFQNFVEG